MVCLCCGKPLSFLSRLRHQRYCSEEHHRKYISEQDENAFQELLTPRAEETGEETQPEPTEEQGAPELDVGTIDAKDALQVLIEEERNPEEEEFAALAEADVPAGHDEKAQAGEPGAGGEEPEPVPPIETSAEPRNGASSNGGAAMPPDIAHFLSMVEAERHYYQNILDVLPAAVAVFMEDRSLAYCNRSFRKLIDPGQRDLFELKLNELFFQEEVREAVSGVLDRKNEEAGAIVDQITGDGIKRLQIIAEALTAKDGDLGPQALVAVNVVPSAE